MISENVQDLVETSKSSPADPEYEPGSSSLVSDLVSEIQQEEVNDVDEVSDDDQCSLQKYVQKFPNVLEQFNVEEKPAPPQLKPEIVTSAVGEDIPIKQKQQPTMSNSKGRGEPQDYKMEPVFCGVPSSQIASISARRGCKGVIRMKKC